MITGLAVLQLEVLTTRRLRIKKFQQATWGNQLEYYFLKRKGQLDRAIYSLIRIKDPEIAQELYFRSKSATSRKVETLSHLSAA
jgi:parvulin-like peptidyl-prolyl isomerase